MSVAAIAFGVLAVTTTLTGGSSRPDIVWLMALRPVSVLCIVAMLLGARPEWRAVRPLSLLLTLFAATIAVQLIPLPPTWWHALPGRETYVTVSRMMDGADRWHAVSLAPDRTWNSLIALLTPLGTLLGYAALDERRRQWLLWPMLAIVGISMLLGIAQIAGGGTSPLYWYQVSGRGQLIGLFANRNHQGALLAAALPLLRAWTLMPASGRRAARTRLVAALCAAGTIILYVIVLGSRAGLALAALGFVGAILVDPILAADRRTRRRAWIIAAGGLVATCLLIGLTLSADRAVSIGRIVNDDLSAEGRIAALPTLFDIIRDTLPFGTGFGSFVQIYASYEPDALLKPTYFNNAHNDLIEVAITGGIPALTVVAAFLIWWAAAAFRSIGTMAPNGWRPLQRGSALAILILLLASLADYPLRTPLMGMIFTILCCWLAHRPATESHADVD